MTMARCPVLYESWFSPRGAAYLSGNIKLKAGWVPNRPPWDDVGEMRVVLLVGVVND